MVPLLADENFPLPAIRHLRQLDYDVLTLRELDMNSRAVPDDQVLALATNLNRCLLTLNRKEFIKLHKQNNSHAGILIATFDSDFVALAQRINDCLSGNQVVGQHFCVFSGQT